MGSSDYHLNDQVKRSTLYMVAIHIYTPYVHGITPWRLLQGYKYVLKMPETDDTHELAFISIYPYSLRFKRIDGPPFHIDPMILCRLMYGKD